MNAERLLLHYERIADAPDAIARLRRFILDLAVRGKLVPQASKEEPASELLKRITKEKVRSIKAGELRDKTSLPEISEDEKPFKLPSTWAWVRVGDIFSYDAGSKRDPKDLQRDRWLLELEDIEKDTSNILARLRVSDRDSLSTKSEFEVGDILYGKLRPYLNKVVVADEPGYSTTEIVAIRPFMKLDPAYCALAFRRPDFVAYVERLGQGTKMPRLRTPDAIVAVFPLPPLAEQHRIVAKVDELMALCDRLEAARAAREATRDRLAASTLARLNTPDPATFQADATFALNTIPALTTRSDQIKQLRQTILNLAVRGKLVPQEPQDEPAADLLSRIAREKSRILHDRKSTAKVSIERDHAAVSFDLPTIWTWCQLDEISWKITDGDHLTPKREIAGHYLLSARNVLNGRIDVSDVDFVGDAEFERMRKRCDPDKFDLLISCSGSIGRVAIVDKDNAYVMVRSAALVKPAFARELAPYLAKALISDALQAQMSIRAKAAAQPNLFIGSIRQLIVPLPPLAEQHRIVAKVDALMKICDQLEASLDHTATTRRHLLDALLAEALAPAQTREREAAE